MICKYLEWRDVGNFKKALPQISVSGAELDVVKRSLKEISNKKNVIEEEIVCIEIELEESRSIISIYYLISTILHHMI